MREGCEKEKLDVEKLTETRNEWKEIDVRT
jgi:hypothetical protein